MSVSITWKGKQLLPKTPLTPEAPLSPKIPLTQLQEMGTRSNFAPHPEVCVIPQAEVLPEEEEEEEGEGEREGEGHKGVGLEEKEITNWKITDLEATPPADDTAESAKLSLADPTSDSHQSEKSSTSPADNTLCIHFYCTNHSILEVSFILVKEYNFVRKSSNEKFLSSPGIQLTAIHSICPVQCDAPTCKPHPWVRPPPPISSALHLNCHSEGPGPLGHGMHDSCEEQLSHVRHRQADSSMLCPKVCFSISCMPCKVTACHAWHQRKIGHSSCQRLSKQFNFHFRVLVLSTSVSLVATPPPSPSPPPLAPPTSPSTPGKENEAARTSWGEAAINDWTISAEEDEDRMDLEGKLTSDLCSGTSE